MKRLQNESEIQWFCDLLAVEGVRSYLEIGSKFGASLQKVASALPVGSRVVSVDLPAGARETEKRLRGVVEELKAKGYDARLIIGDSTHAHVIEQARSFGPFDAVFIDANHSLPYVTKDFENYGPMAKIVAFHDIAYVPRPGHDKGIEVPKFWNSIKGNYRHVECRLDGPHNGFGVIWQS